MDNALAGRYQAAEPVRLIERPAARKATLKLCSQVPGRERWHVDALVDRPRLAAAVELVLRTEDGIKKVRANPLTGRVLVCYEPGLLTESVETLIRRALAFGPMSREEFSLLRSSQSGGWSVRSLVLAELSCSVFEMIVLGGVCPLGIAATALFLLLRGINPRGQCAHAAQALTARSGSSATN
jgi:hypothetical protein